jgi:hypothetical protein
MVRTNRTLSAQAPANMDDIDLDDMFAADGDALFDGLDIDLDLDDITGGPSSVDSKRGAARLPLQSSFPSSSPNDVGLMEDESTRLRRKTKRKPKTPSFFEDDDDDYDDAPPAKKKRKTSAGKAAASNAVSKKKTPKATSTGEEVLSVPMPAPPGIPKGKNKSTKTLSTGMPPPLARTGIAMGAMPPGVAAVGQFGSRQKKLAGSSFPTLPKGAALSASSNHQGGRTINKLPLARSTSESPSVAMKQKSPPRLLPQTSFCGLAPSSTHFYPFMPSLPSEPALKSRKVYGTVDRIHTSLVSYLHTPPTASSGVPLAQEHEPIFQLMQEAFKEEKTGTGAAGNTVRSESIGIAIGELRRTISMFNKNQLVGDWYAVCALLRRQHDFLKQNCENMERWCRDNFSHEDFSFVFAPPNKQRNGIDGGDSVFSILRTFSKRELKVKISCSGLKDPKMLGVLPAVLPISFLPSEMLLSDEKESKAVSKKKSDAANQSEGRISEHFLSAQNKLKPPPQPLSYANMKPARRRRNVSEMIARTARELEKGHLARNDLRLRSMVTQKEEDLEKVAQEADSVSLGGIHSTGMWKWFELSGYFSGITESETQERLDDFRAKVLLLERPPKSAAGGTAQKENDSSLFDRLQTLLVDVESGEEYGDDVNDSDINEICAVTETADMSQLALDERSFLQIRRFGLFDKNQISSSAVFTTSDPISRPNLPIEGCEVISSSADDPAIEENGSSHVALSRVFDKNKDDSLDGVIGAMKDDLGKVEDLNGRRVAFLEKMSRVKSFSNQRKQQRSEREANLVAKCQLLMRRAKEQKAKSGVLNRKDDSLALPW